MHNFCTLFGKELYMFQTDLLSIIRSLNTVFTAIGIFHTSYVDRLLADGNISSMTHTYRCEYGIKTPDDGQ
jgi:hypothetical protein